jgi:DNA-binding response OmpR family regulator
MVEPGNGILLVVDDASLRAGLSMNLRVEGYEVFTAPQDTPANLEVLSRRFAAALVDADAGSSVEWLREARAAGMACLVLCRPEGVSEWRARLSLDDGQVVSKPFGLEPLLASIRRMLPKAS